MSILGRIPGACARAGLLAGLLVFAGCGSGGSSGPDSAAAPNTPVAPISPPAATSCTGNHLVNVVAAFDDGQSIAGKSPDLAIDDNLDPASRWESPGDARSITLDLGARHLVREVGIAWFEGDRRTATFRSLRTSGVSGSMLNIATGCQACRSTRRARSSRRPRVSGPCGCQTSRSRVRTSCATSPA